MVQDLTDFIRNEENILSSFIQTETGKTNSAIIKKAKKLKLTELIQAITSKEEILNNLAREAKKEFEDGSTIEFNYFGLSFDINPQKIEIYYQYSLVNSYSGTRVKKFYNEFSEKVKNAIDEELSNLAF
jgi:methyl coenzyme M reductase subunit C-like uncharacterized protein (methanogenesis marker protein 7)